MEFTQYIAENALILPPFLYVLGMIIKNTEKVSDKFIPIILLPMGILGAIGIMGFNLDSVVQGVLITGATVYTDQLVKQSGKIE